MEVSPRKLIVAAVAPSIFRVLPTTTDGEQRDMILLGIWKTRCKSGRVDLIVWKPWMQPPHRICDIRGGDPVKQLLAERFCVVDEPYDLRQPIE